MKSLLILGLVLGLAFGKPTFDDDFFNELADMESFELEDLPNEPTDSGPSSAGPTDSGPSSAGPTESGPSSAEPTESGPSSAEPTDSGPSSAEPTDSGPTESGLSSSGPTESGLSSSGPTESGPSSAEPTDSGPSNSGPTESGLSSAEPTDSGPSNSGPTESGLSSSGPTESAPSSAEPTESGPSNSGPTESGPSSAGPTAIPCDQQENKTAPILTRFLHFLRVKSVCGVKPDEHPDLKYMKPGKELVDELLEVRKAVLGTVKPFMEILRLMKKDQEEMMRRVREAVQEQNIAKATHIVGEYFIAIQRRIAMLVIHAAQKGLFAEVDEGKDVNKTDVEAIKRELQDHANKSHEAAKYILENFSEYRVSDGLLDAPFVDLGVATSQVMEQAKQQITKVVKVYIKVYVDMISQMVSLSLDRNDHEAAVKRAGSGVLSFVRRGTKTKIALYKLHEAKHCKKDEREDKENRKD